MSGCARGNVGAGEEADLVIIEDFVGCFRVLVGDFVLEDAGNVFAGVAETCQCFRSRHEGECG